MLSPSVKFLANQRDQRWQRREHFVACRTARSSAQLPLHCGQRPDDRCVIAPEFPAPESGSWKRGVVENQVQIARRKFGSEQLIRARDQKVDRVSYWLLSGICSRPLLRLRAPGSSDMD